MFFDFFCPQLLAVTATWINVRVTHSFQSECLVIHSPKVFCLTMRTALCSRWEWFLHVRLSEKQKQKCNSDLKRNHNDMTPAAQSGYIHFTVATPVLSSTQSWINSDLIENLCLIPHNVGANRQHICKVILSIRLDEFPFRKSIINAKENTKFLNIFTLDCSLHS